MKNFKYKSLPFESSARILAPAEANVNLALASLDYLKGLVPETVNFDSNPDVIFTSFNAANCGYVNKNDDVIDVAAGLDIYKNFIYKFCDIEHNRNFIVGSIINAGFSSFEDNVILGEEDARNSAGPVNICLAAVVWRVLNEDFADQLVKSSDENSIFYNSISSSWELGFDSYHIVLGDRDISKGELITDEKQIEEFSKYLRANRGEGKTKDGVPVYRKIVGDMYPLGLGFVRKPAAEVSGVLVVEDNILDLAESKEVEVIEITTDEKSEGAKIGEEIKELLQSAAKLEKTSEKAAIILKSIYENQENNKNIEKQNKNSVNKNTDLLIKEKPVIKNKNNMKLKFKDITKDTLETLAASDVYEVAKDLDKAMTQYAETLDVKEQEAKAAQEKFDKVKSDYDAIAAELEKVKADLQKLNDIRAAEKIQNDFNAHMAQLNEAYELDVEKSKAIAGLIRGMDDESFATWLDGFKSFLVAKKFVPFEKKDGKDKKEGKEDEEEMEESECKKKDSSCASLIEEIEKLKPEDKKIVNKVSSNKSVSDLVNEAFGELIPKE